MRILLAVGHGVRDGGTYDPGAGGSGWTEQSAGDIIVAEAARVLTALGADVRHEAFKADPDFVGTIRAANTWPADYVVEVHHDWSLAPEGAFGHWYTEPSHRFADAIQAAVGAAGFPLRPDWHKRRTDLSIIKRVVAPCVLYEVGRIGSGTLNTPDELRAMGRAIAAGIAAHVGLKQASEEDDMPIDKVKAHHAAAAEKILITEHVLNEGHPADDAASVGLVEVLDSRILSKLVALEGRVKALEARL